jgi:hypothetical protein
LKTPTVPGLLQTEEYVRQSQDAFQSIVFMPPRHVDRLIFKALLEGSLTLDETRDLIP